MPPTIMTSPQTQRRRHRRVVMVAGKQLEPVDIARIGYGAMLVARPRALAWLAGTGTTESRALRSTVRLLGARHVVQGFLTPASGTAFARNAATVVDVAHAASDLVFGATHQSWLRAASLDATAALSFASRNRNLARERSSADATAITGAFSVGPPGPAA